MNLKKKKKNLKYKGVITEVDVKCAGDTNSYGSDWKESMLYVPRRHPWSTFPGRNGKRCSIRKTGHISINIRTNVALKNDATVISLKHQVSFCCTDRLTSNMEEKYNSSSNNIITNIPSMVKEKNYLPSDFALFYTSGGVFFLFQFFCSAPLIHPYGPEHKGVTLPFHHSTLDGRLPGLVKRTRIKEEKSMKK